MAGREQGIQAAGLGARDTLRLEAAMPLYGHELSEDINPYQAGLGFAVNLQDRDFVGRGRIGPIRAGCHLAAPHRPDPGGSPRPPRTLRRAYSGRRTGRDGDPAATFSPTLDRPIAMAYVRPDVAELDTVLAVDIRGKQQPARTVELPFYTRSQ